MYTNFLSREIFYRCIGGTYNGKENSSIDGVRPEARTEERSAHEGHRSSREGTRRAAGSLAEYRKSSGSPLFSQQGTTRARKDRGAESRYLQHRLFSESRRRNRLADHQRIRNIRKRIFLCIMQVSVVRMPPSS